MSRKYLGLIVLNTKDLDGNSVDDLVTTISKEIETEGAKLEQINQIGRRKFAYDSSHIDAGHYVEYTFESTPELINKIQNRLQGNDHVYLQHYKRA